LIRIAVGVPYGAVCAAGSIATPDAPFEYDPLVSRRRWTRRTLLVLFVSTSVYAALVLYPQMLFAHEVRAGNVVLHARAAMPRQAAEIAENARRRLAASPFYDAADTYDVFFCDTPGLFTLFTLWDHGAGGVTQVYFAGHIFLRPAHIERDRLVGPSGKEAPGDRTLTYFIAHELTHTATARHLGRWRYFRLARWQQDGYADYVGKGGHDGTFDFDATLRDFRAGTRELQPAQSGLYLRYHLLVAYLLDRAGMTPEALLSEPRDQVSVEQALP